MTLQLTSDMDDEFARFEQSWQRLADKYNSVRWSRTRQFIPYLVPEISFTQGDGRRRFDHENDSGTNKQIFKF
jgi:hypothetical protein